MSVDEVVVGRQPVFDRDLEVIGYELLFGSLAREESVSDQPAPAPDDDADDDLMTSVALFSSVGTSITRLVGDKLVFCNVDRERLVNVEPMGLPADRAVIEIQASDDPDDEVLAGCRRLVKEGFMVALDHCTAPPEREGLLELASLVKVDPRIVAPSDLALLIERCRSTDTVLVAEGVETTGELESAKALGFDLFQGYFLSRPRVAPGKKLDPLSLSRLQLAGTLVRAECDAARLEEIVKAEPTMAHQLLQMAGVGADHGLRRNVRSLREAIVMVGWRQLQSWIALLLLTHRSQTSGEEVVTVLTRAKMCELLVAARNPRQAGFAFTAGLLSGFDLLLGSPIDEVLVSMPLDEELQEAVLGHDTELGGFVADVVDYQFGRFDEAVRRGIEATALHKAATKALTWAVFVSSGLSWPTRAPARLRRDRAMDRARRASLARPPRIAGT